MLVIARREGEDFYLSLAEGGDDSLTARELFKEPIRIMVTEADGVVRLGVDAPKAIKVRRDEPWDENKRR